MNCITILLPGYAGNDDCGEMSAWYVFGPWLFYPVNPVVLGMGPFPFEGDA